MRVTPFGGSVSALQRIYERGLPHGSLTGWACLDELYRPSRGAFTVVTGIPNHGKSAWLDALMVNLLHHPCEGRPWRFFICSPEQEPVELHIAEILERHLGKTFQHGHPRRMQWADVEGSLQTLSSRIVMAQLGETDTFADLMGEAVSFAIGCAQNNEQAGIIFDPWNRLEHRRPPRQTETEYVSDVLTQVVNLTRQTKAHMWVVAHPHMMARDAKGNRPVPTPYDIAGSAHWYNKADNCITVWRNVAATPGTVEAKETHIHVQKIRWKHQGRIGLAILHYDAATGRYYDPEAAEAYRRVTEGA